MSFYLTSYVIRWATEPPNIDLAALPSISEKAFRVLLVLTDCADNLDQTCWPSYNLISKRTQIHRSKIEPLLRELKTAKIIETRKRFNASTIYTIKIHVPPSFKRPSESSTPNTK